LNHLEFCEFIGPAAYELEQTRGYPMEAAMTQVHLETGGLASYPAGSNNVLGIKFNGVGEYVESGTYEYINGVKTWVADARWQKYPSIVNCLESWADLMDKPWYDQAQPYRDCWAAFIGLVWHNGTETVYATDPLYQWKAVKRAADVGIPQWCAAYRAKMAPAAQVAIAKETVTKEGLPARLIIDGVEIDCGALLVGDWLHADIDPLLLMLQRYGVRTSYDQPTRTMTITTPIAFSPEGLV
jgi:flagellum-specific peptidoglycan hydrolase FlgJ